MIGGMTRLRSRAEKEQLVPAELSATFDVKEKAPKLFRELCRQSSEFEAAYRDLTAALYIPQSARVAMDRHFFRLPNHNRSFCYRLSPSDDLSKGLDTDVLVFKGAEPLMPDFAKYLQWLSQTKSRAFHLPMLDFFPMAEGKIGGVLTLREAQLETEIAWRVQEAHLDAYGSLAAIPTPVFIHALPKETVGKIAELLRKLMRKRAFDRIAPFIDAGFVVMSYYFPHAPIRSDFFGTAERALLKPHLGPMPDLEETVDRWIRLYARLLQLGFLPGTPMSASLGCCADPGNSTIFGGFCDIDSIAPISEAYNSAYLYESLGLSLNTLESSLRKILQASANPHTFAWGFKIRIYEGLRKFLLEEKKPGCVLDPRISYFLSPEKNLVEMVMNYADEFNHQSRDQYD
jgi:hypothetical protein